MLSDNTSLLLDVERLYANRRDDIGFSDVLRGAEDADDEMLAELIDADGRCRLSRERPVDLNRYLSAIPGLYERPIALDAAVDVTLRALSSSARAAPHAVEQLIKAHPQIESVIREAAALSMAVWSTTGLRDQIGPEAPVKELPCEFGPSMPTGEARFVLQRLLGRGAFGQVYLALDRQMSEEGHTALVAIKILVIGSQSPFARDRLIEEATKVRRISHPNVVQVLDRGVTTQNEDYIVYEYVDGGDLGDALMQQPRWPIREAAELVRRIALGVHAAHAAGVIHCDLKPGNIMLTSKREPKVADFGVAVRFGENRRALLDQHGSAGALIGNLAFISPEQYRNEPNALSVLSDIYALGGILYLLLTGTLPNGSTVPEIARTHDAERGRNSAPALRDKRAEIDRDLERICQRALAPKAEERYSSASALADDLEHWLRLEPIQWTNPSLRRVAWLWARRKPALAISLLLLGLVSAVALAVGLHLSQVAEAKRIETAVEKEKGRMARALATAAKSLKVDYRLNTDALARIWLLEYVFGPTALGMPDVQADLWKHRIENIRNLVKDAESRGEADHLETLEWQSALAFWLVRDKDYAEAEPLLDYLTPKWQARLVPDDRWLQSLSAISICAEVNRHLALSLKQPAQLFPRDRLSAIDAELQAMEKKIAARYRGTAMHYLVIDALMDLYGPTLLNEASRKKELEAMKEKLLDTSEVKQSIRSAQTAKSSAQPESK